MSLPFTRHIAWKNDLNSLIYTFLIRKKKMKLIHTSCLTELFGAKIEVIPIKLIPTVLLSHPIIWGQTMAYFNGNCTATRECLSLKN